MKTMAIILFFLFSLSLVQAKTFDLALTIHKNDSVELRHFEILEAEPEDLFNYQNTDYSFKMVSAQGVSLWEKDFTIGFVGHIDVEPSSNLSDTVSLDSQYVNFRLPYSENAKYIQLYHLDKQIWQYDVEQPVDSPSAPAGDYTGILLLGGLMVLILILIGWFFIRRGIR